MSIIINYYFYKLEIIYIYNNLYYKLFIINYINWIIFIIAQDKIKFIIL